MSLRNKDGNEKTRPHSLIQLRPLSQRIKLDRVKSMQVTNQKKVLRKRTEPTGTLEELVQCPICLDRLHEPKMLPCQHTFCLSCLEFHLTLKNSKVFGCPTCNKEMTVAGSLQDLPNNMYLESILKMVNSENKSATAISPTETNFIYSSCVKCNTIDNFHLQTCEHCKLVFCMVCWNEHADQLQEKLPEFFKQLRECEERMKYKIEDLERNSLQLKEAVKLGTQAKIAELHEHEKTLLEEIEKCETSAQDTSEILKQKIKSLCEEIKNLNTKPDQADKIKLYMEYHKEVSQLLEEISRFGETHAIIDSKGSRLDEDVHDITIEENDTRDALQSDTNMLQHYRSRVFNPKFIWTKCPKPAGVGVPPWAPELLYIAATDSKEVYILNKIKIKIVARLVHEEMLCPHSLCFFDERKEIFISDKWKHCVHVFSKDGEYIRCLLSRGRDLGQVISPQGLTISNKGQLIVCDSGNDRVLILDPLNGNLLSMIGPVGSSRKVTALNMPTDVATFEDKIIIADTGNHRVKIYNSKGEKLKEIGCMGREKGQLRFAEVIAIDPLGFIFVGDAGNGRIQIFDINGNFVRAFSGVNLKTGKFKWISGICVTPSLDIIATDSKNKCVIMF